MNSEFTIALHCLVLLAHRPDHMANSDMIAHNVSTHPARVRKVLGCLRKQGFVTTKEGIGGGYLLHCDPDETTLAEIYQATASGSIKPGWCSGDVSQECMISCNMAEVMDGIFYEAEEQLLAYLRKLTISDVLERTRQLQELKG